MKCIPVESCGECPVSDECVLIDDEMIDTISISTIHPDCPLPSFVSRDDVIEECAKYLESFDDDSGDWYAEMLRKEKP